MDVVYALGRATAAQVRENLPDAPCTAAVRTMLRILEDKRQLRHEKEGVRHVYLPVTPRAVAQRSALKHMLRTFFGGSPSAVVAALVDESERSLTSAERRELDSVIRRLRGAGR